MECDEIEDARRNLHTREGGDYETDIAAWPHPKKFALSENISRWATPLGIDAVVWTALGNKWDGQLRKPFVWEVIAYLKQLVIEQKHEKAKEYIEKAPAQVKTPYRAAIERELGWKPVTS